MGLLAQMIKEQVASQTAPQVSQHQEIRPVIVPEGYTLASNGKIVPKLDLKFTTLVLKSKREGTRTELKLISPKFSLHGYIEKVVEFPSFEPPYTQIYLDSVSSCLSTLKEILKIGERCGVNPLED